MPVIPATLKAEIGRILVQGLPGQIVHKTISISKITTVKWIGGVAQAAESLLCKHKALSPNKEQKQKKEFKRSFSLHCLPKLGRCWPKQRNETI
jgi:hypothetical protein